MEKKVVVRFHPALIILFLVKFELKRYKENIFLN